MEEERYIAEISRAGVIVLSFDTSDIFFPVIEMFLADIEAQGFEVRVKTVPPGCDESECKAVPWLEPPIIMELDDEEGDS